MNLPEQSLPAGFLALPENVQKAIVSDGQRIGNEVVAHTVQVLVGAPAAKRLGARVNHASGVQIHFEGNRYLATAAHVVRHYASRVVEEPGIIAQVGNGLVPLLDRIVWWDEERDLAVLALEDAEAALIPAKAWTPGTWPPPLLDEDDYVAFSGFPVRYREDNASGDTVLNAIGGILRVESVSERRLTSVMDRENLVRTKGHEIPPQDAALGGMSGGPVFRVKNGGLDLVALIKEHSMAFDALFFVPLGGAILNHSSRVVL